MFNPESLCGHQRFALSGSPSTCALDVVIVPIPSILFILGSGVILLKSGRSLWHPQVAGGLPKWLHILYAALVFAAFGMGVLEIARDIAADFGVGLLPIDLIAVAFAFLLLAVKGRRRSSTISLLLVVYWALYAIVAVVKVARLHLLETENPTTMKNSNYPSSDLFLDNAVMLGLYISFTIFEMTQLFLVRGIEDKVIKFGAIPTKV
ncbi:hypothetical protein PUNSTDRAFT_123078 [Punctularia strigosozonata HHB-11173 SS5]|uniref:Uncharacterized protein n=1 Tax=Punctularia strigosozonata (strain HHB-11173) TaxID=741275 RepID=R7S1D7_PUNST|nr:uncharacterized protein PUNSTDRAFT_123078 [Punctularia strigosozonata HHB-11173 SS5]EIN04038.1 hypothetical protein PUNSTDRAFT_123078 [Punctularia strigosozonata HHB-11173 SS5]